MGCDMTKNASGRCIFCGGASGSSMSKEHVFPDWLRQVFPRSQSDTHTHGTVSWAGLTQGGLVPVTIRQKKQGHVSTKKVRVVCTRCNNGWLSGIEESTKPLLLSVISGDPITLDAPKRAMLATWAAKTIMTAEFVDRKLVAIPSEDRTYLMNNIAPPNAGWWIWIAGNCGVEWETGIYHFSSRLNTSLDDLKTPDILNLQCTTIGLGHLLVHAISTTVGSHSFSLTRPDASDLKPIWPDPTTDITWPPSKLLTDDDVNVIKTNIERAYGIHSGHQL